MVHWYCIYVTMTKRDCQHYKYISQVSLFSQNKYCMIKSRQYLWWRQWPHTTHNDTKHSNLTSIILLSLVTIHNLFSQPLLSDTTRAHQDHTVTTVGSKKGRRLSPRIFQILIADWEDFCSRLWSVLNYLWLDLLSLVDWKYFFHA